MDHPDIKVPLLEQLPNVQRPALSVVGHRMVIMGGQAGPFPLELAVGGSRPVS